MYGGGTSTHLHEYVPLEGEEATLEVLSFPCNAILQEMFF